MPMYVYCCGKCDLDFEELRGLNEKGKPKCPKCKKSKNVRQQVTSPRILGPTSSKMDNFGYRAGYNLEKAQNESRTARELAAKQGINPGYGQIDDVSSGANFDPEAW